MKKTLLDHWTFSTDEEWWGNEDYPTREEAIEAGKDAYGDPNSDDFGDFYIGQIEEVRFEYQDAEWLDLAEKVIENFVDMLSDEVGEGSEQWYDNISKENEDELNRRLAKAVMDWIEDCGMQNNVDSVTNVERIAVEEENETN